jgi:RimJ/RimL family protein N-acetyltransferase
VGWVGTDGGPRLFRRDGLFEPLGYLEVNPMPGQPGHHWLGHCVIRPEHRGTGLGRVMIELALTEAFEVRGARQISLMVFPENLVAYRCYLRTGFREINDQYKYFATTGKRYRMVQMGLNRDGYEIARRGRPGGAGPALADA